MKNYTTVLAVGAGAALLFFMYSSGEKKEKRSELEPGDDDGEVLWTMQPGVRYTVHTRRDGAPNQYLEVVGDLTTHTIGDEMRDGGELLRIEEAGEA